MQEEELLLVIILMMVVTYISRVFPMIIPSRYYPSWLKESLEFLPAAIIAVVVLPDIILQSYESYFLTPMFLTSIVAILIAIYSKSLIITVIASLVVLYTLGGIL